MKQNTGKKLLGFLLTLALLVGLMPGMSLTAMAIPPEQDHGIGLDIGVIVQWNGGPYASLLNTTTVVKFNNHDWYIIADNSTAVDAGTVTLLAADTSFGISKFHDSSNAYSSSTVNSMLVALTAEGGAFASVKDAIADTNLSDVNVTGAKLYLLSTSEAQPHKNFYFSGAKNGSWWLRSQGSGSNNAAYVHGGNSYVFVNGDDVSEQFGVRPALQLDLSKVTFDSTTNTFSMLLPSSTLTGAPTGKPLTFNAQPQPLVTAGSVEGGTLEYALGTDATNAPASGWSTSVPTAAEPGTYYVWYRVVGDENHNDVAPTCIVVTIEKSLNPAENADFTLLATLKTSGKKALKLSWTAVEGAEGYDIFFGRSSEAAAQYLTSVNAQTFTVKKLTQGIGYRASVQAWRTVNGQKTYIGQPSPDAFAITGGKTAVNFTNPKKISVKKKKMALNVGGTKAIKASVKKAVAGRKYLNKVAKVRYFSSDRRVATVDAKGNITAVGAGTCKVFAVAANGLRVGVNVTVK